MYDRRFFHLWSESRRCKRAERCSNATTSHSWLRNTESEWTSWLTRTMTFSIAISCSEVILLDSIILSWLELQPERLVSNLRANIKLDTNLTSLYTWKTHTLMIDIQVRIGLEQSDTVNILEQKYIVEKKPALHLKPSYSSRY